MPLRLTIPAMLALLLLGACATPAPLPLWRTTVVPAETRTVIPVFFATDRIPSDPATLTAPFTHEVRLDRANPIRFGKATGTIKRTPASLGACEPGWWEQTSAPGKAPTRFPLRAVDTIERDGFYESLSAELARVARVDAAVCSETTPLAGRGRRVLLYVHGFNDGFGEAAGNAAQLAYDLDIRAVPVIYSWPTQQSLLQYTRDETYAERAAPLLKQLIAGLADRVKPDELYIVAHSMGARITLQALQELATERPGRFIPATTLILYAADLDTLVFERVYMDELSRYARRVSVYANTHDVPLSASRRVNGGYALGDFDGAPFTGKGFSTIDIGAARQSPLNHSGFEDSPLITQQIQADLLGTPPAERACLCRIAPEGIAALNPKGREPFYRLAPDRAQCPFTLPAYRARKTDPPCAD